MDLVDGLDVAIVGRLQNSVVLKYNKSIIITTDILSASEGVDEGVGSGSTITLDNISNKIDMFAEDMLMSAKSSERPQESFVYGESLVELLRWIIERMKDHSHPPNGTSIPTWHPEANTRSERMEQNLLNKRITHR
jgi:hypothetical protein